jgi:hypothetical protein
MLVVVTFWSCFVFFGSADSPDLIFHLSPTYIKNFIRKIGTPLHLEVYYPLTFKRGWRLFRVCQRLPFGWIFTALTDSPNYIPGIIFIERPSRQSWPLTLSQLLITYVRVTVGLLTVYNSSVVAHWAPRLEYYMTRKPYSRPSSEVVRRAAEWT